MVTRLISLTCARDKMLANEAGLYHTVPKLGRLPTKVETCVPPFVETFRCWALGQMLRSKCLLQNTDTVDWLSSRIQVCGMMVVLSAAMVANVVP